MLQHAYTKPPGGAHQSGFAIPRQASKRKQMMNGRGQAISIVTLGALLIVVYLIAYSPWGNYRAVLHVLQRTNDFEEQGSVQRLPINDQRSAKSVFISGNGSDLGVVADKMANIYNPAQMVLDEAAAEFLWNGTALDTTLALYQGNAAEMCRLLLPTGAQTLAIVGNGPLSDVNRAAMAHADSTLRFNELNNRLHPDEALGMWAVRANYRPDAPYWGFWQLRKSSRLASLVNAATGVILLGGDADQATPLLHKYPQLLGKVYHVNTAQYSHMYRKFFNGGRSVKPYPPDPSTGLLGILQLRACLEMRSSDAHLHLFGFNWSPRHWETHMMKAEEHIVKEMLRSVRYTVNPTACSGLRSCDPGCDRPDYVLQRDGTKKACAT